MSFTDKKLEIASLALVAVMVGGLGYIFKSPVQAVLANADVSYEMPRPKSFLAALFGLGLEDREINRKYVNPFDKKKADAKKAADAKAAAPSAPKAVAQKKTDAKKAADAAKKPSVDVNVVGNGVNPGLSAGDIANGGNGNNGGGGGVSSNYETGNANNTATDKTKDDKTGMSGDQWRAMISGQPTKENVSKLINAYFSKDVDDATFYTIVNDLLRNNKAETQAVGLYAVSSVYSSQSFATVASNFDQLTTENKTSAQSYLMGYANSGRSGILLTSLKSTKADVVEFAAQVIIEGYKTAKSGTVVSNPRNSRGDVNTASNVVSDYSKFVPVFQQLAQSSDASIAGLANSALSQMQTVASL